LPLVTKLEEIEIDEKLIEVTAMRSSVAKAFSPQASQPELRRGADDQPLDYGKRESFSQATSSRSRRSAWFPRRSSSRSSRNSSRTPSPLAGSEDVDIGAVADVITNTTRRRRREISAADLENEDSAPIIQLTNRIIEDAYICGASDIHIEPMEKICSSATASMDCARKSCACPRP